MKLLFDESLSPRLVPLLLDLFPESESALRNGLARVGDRRILEYAQRMISSCRYSPFLRLSNRDRGGRASA
jgi:predicted nuclease of predicted toxin-antitoxin system